MLLDAAFYHELATLCFILSAVLFALAWRNK